MSAVAVGSTPSAARLMGINREGSGPYARSQRLLNDQANGPCMHGRSDTGTLLGSCRATAYECGGIQEREGTAKLVEDRVRMVRVRRITGHARVDPPGVNPEHPSPPSAP